AGRIRRELDENTARLAEVHRMEVVPIDERRRMQPALHDALAEVELLRVVRYTECHVMHRPRAAHTARKVADRSHVDDGARTAVACGEAARRAVLARRPAAEDVGEHALARRGVA